MLYLLTVMNPGNDPGSTNESGSSPKSNRLVPGPRLAPPKNFIKIFEIVCGHTHRPLRNHYLLGEGNQYSNIGKGVVCDYLRRRKEVMFYLCLFVRLFVCLWGMVQGTID